MNCEQCLGANSFVCAPFHAAKTLVNGVARLWRNALNVLSQFG
jgi:hypothetical protein